ncbi:hypothetical protein [Methylorubrum thiocyanatum]|uniref:hypothetical protein n=1 Tax=Methylorubrum thiocyanatum TaxID=47958 RepID=UPI0035C791DA
MTLDQSERAKELAASREALLLRVRTVQSAACPEALFGYVLDDGMENALRTAFVTELHQRVAQCEADLRELGIPFPELGTLPHPPSHWDADSGEFSFVVASTGVQQSERGLSMGGERLVDEMLVTRGYRQGRRPALVYAGYGVVVGEVLRVWEEADQVRARARLRPEASAARAAVASGAVTDVCASYTIHEERFVQRVRLRPLVIVEAWSILHVHLLSDAGEDLGCFDPPPAKDVVEAP